MSRLKVYCDNIQRETDTRRYTEVYLTIVMSFEYVGEKEMDIVSQKTTKNLLLADFSGNLFKISSNLRNFN